MISVRSVELIVCFWLFMNSAVKKEEYANATKYFLLARRILGRYEHISSFKVGVSCWLCMPIGAGCVGMDVRTLG